MKRNLHLAVTALAVAQALGFPASFAYGGGIFAEAVTVESLQDRLLELKDQANNIQARADAEQRDMTDDETREVQGIFAHFETTEADIERRQKLGEINNKMAAPAGRKTNHEIVEAQEDDNTTRAQAQARAQNKDRDRQYPTPRSQESGKWGFRSPGEFMNAVLRASAKGSVPDPRLIANAAPSTYGSEGVGQDGGFSVPPDFRQTIVQKIMGTDSLLPLTDEQTSSSNTITFPADETTPWQTSGGIQAYWEAEAGLKQQSKPALVEKTVKLNKIIALIPMTDELLEDAPAMASYVNRKAPEKMTFKINDAIINGSGVGMPLGILTSPGTVVVPKESGQAASTVVYNNIVRLASAVTPSARGNARWLIHPDAEPLLSTMSFPGAGTAVPAYMPPGGLSSSPYATLYGRPVIFSEACQPLGSQGDMIFGDLKNYLSVTKQGGIKSDVSIHIWFDYDLTAFRFVLRVGGQPWWNTPILPFQTGATSRGFFATLQARP